MLASLQKLIKKAIARYRMKQPQTKKGCWNNSVFSGRNTAKVKDQTLDINHNTMTDE